MAELIVVYRNSLESNHYCRGQTGELNKDIMGTDTPVSFSSIKVALISIFPTGKC